MISCPTSLVIENHQVTGKDAGFRLCNISTAKRRFARFRRRATWSLLQKQNYSSTNYVSRSRFSLIESEGLNQVPLVEDEPTARGRRHYNLRTSKGVIKMRQKSGVLRVGLWIIAILVSVGFASPQQGFAQDSQACNDGLIRGTYGFSVEGLKLTGPGPVGPQVGVALATYDGVGGFTQIDTVTINGTVVADFTHSPATGTYTVNSDCTGTFTINFTDGRPAVVANFVVVRNGAEIDAVVVSAGGNPGILATSSIGKRRFAKNSPRR